ncbi:SDR family NAD(P)-dependent oxidoreductase [Nocardia alni]|uniref:SDR family NAD(P)-dependent oxidoreductase n=1 Tax=Nocardia alni TaxID=2815723 RepID=UPI001C228789|nr:SDR family NAD(P)-dependent oxidoreductase [Nocardia alni]
MSTILITGATDGLGRALADQLAAEGETLILHGRDAEKLRHTADSLTATGARIHTAVADLADLAQVHRLAAEVTRLTDRLDVLVSNAGIGGGLPDGRTRQTSADGYELRFAVNYLAGFALTLDLLELLRNSAPARIVNVASLGQHPLDFDDLMIEHGYSGSRAYGQSKLAQIMSGVELADRVPNTEITVNSLHPATYMPTKIVMREAGHSIDTLATGVTATHRLIKDPALRTTTGRFYDRTHETRADAQAYDPAARHELWQHSLRLIDAARTD